MITPDASESDSIWLDDTSFNHRPVQLVKSAAAKWRTCDLSSLPEPRNVLRYSPSRDPFAGHYISPSRVRSIAEGAFALITHGTDFWENGVLCKTDRGLVELDSRI